jgi:hypothetical protein
MISAWLNAVAWLSLILAAISAAIILVDLARRPQKMAIMNWVWPITALYAGPFAIWAYWQFGRPASRKAIAQNGGKTHDKPFWATVTVGVTHCGAGCTLGDIIAEFTIFFGALSVAGSVLWAEFIGDYILAYALGIVFQYFTIAPMRGLSFGPGIWAAIKADTLSLTAFEVGLFGWMALVYFVLFHPHLKPDQAMYWFMMQMGMLIGFATSYPMNWWLVRRGIKEAM